MKTNIDFNELIQTSVKYESTFRRNNYCGDFQEKNLVFCENGTIPIILSAPHSVRHGEKLPEVYTGSIVKLVRDLTGCFIVYSKRSRKDFFSWFNEYTSIIEKCVKENKIRVLIDLHGANINSDFNIDLGTGNGLYIDNKYIDNIKDTFETNGINNIYDNHKFAGIYYGSISRYTYKELGLKTIQIEVNRRLREPSHNNMLFLKLLKSFKEIVEDLNENKINAKSKTNL